MQSRKKSIESNDTARFDVWFLLESQSILVTNNDNYRSAKYLIEQKNSGEFRPLV